MGNAFGEAQRQQGHLGAMVAQVVPELWGVPAMRHEGACASSSLAVLAAMAEIEAGRYDCVLVLGVEEFKNLPGDVASRNQNSASWQGHEGMDCTFMWPAAFGLVAREYDERYGLDRQWLNQIAKQNYANAKDNPLAQTRKWAFDELSFTDDDEANPVIEPGTRRQDCGQITDGACAVVLVSERFLQRHAHHLGHSHNEYARIAGWGHRTAGLRLQDKFERSRHEPYVFPHLRQAIEDAWRRAGIAGIDAVQGVETHDCFTITEYLAIDHLGLTPLGQSWQAVESGRIAPERQLPREPQRRPHRLRPPRGRHGRAHAVGRSKAGHGTGRSHADRGGAAHADAEHRRLVCDGRQLRRRTRMNPPPKPPCRCCFALSYVCTVCGFAPRHRGFGNGFEEK